MSSEGVKKTSCTEWEEGRDERAVHMVRYRCSKSQLIAQHGCKAAALVINS